jgi:uncharacterized protein (TIGR03067 family)
MKSLCAIAVLLLSVSIVAADEAAAKKMLKEIEGNYTPTSLTKSGEAGTEALKAISQITIKADSLMIRFKKEGGSEDHDATIVLDPSQSPVAIDLTPKDGPQAGKPVLGIVKVEKDVVTLCWGDRGEKAERPKEFSSTKENKQFMIVMKKSK